MPLAHHKPYWLFPNLLSLDAPLVAVAWLYIFAKTWRVQYLPWVAYVSLGLVVWIIYASDRLLDVAIRDGETETRTARHRFHCQYKRRFYPLILIAAITTVILVVTGIQSTIYNYALMGGIMVAGFFSLSIFSTKGPDELPYTKNTLAGISFAYGTAMLAFAYTGFEMNELLYSAEFICFAVLCILNISAIDLWQHASLTTDVEVKAIDELALTLPLTLLGAASLIFALKDGELTTRPFFYAILTGAALLQILNRIRTRFSMDALRVLADVAMLVPLLIFLAYSRA